MADPTPPSLPNPSRQDLFHKVLDYVMGIQTIWQLVIVLTLGAAILLGTMLYEHPEWVELVLHAKYGTPEQPVP